MIRTCRFARTLAAAFALIPPLVHAERQFVGVMEADGYQSVVYGASAFGQVAALATASARVDTLLLELLAFPSVSAVSPSDLLRIVQTIDPALPRSDTNPANVALVPIAVAETALRDLFRATYATHLDSGPFTCYEKPSNTNLPPRVVMAITGRHALTSTSLDALQWAWENRARLLDAPAQRIPGTLRILVNPQRLADVLGTRTEQAASLFNSDRFIRDFETLSFSLSLDGQAIAVTLSGKPLANSNLDALARVLHAPSDRLWNGVPDDAFFTSVSACSRPELWDDYLGKARFRLLRPAADLLPPGTYNGERLLFLSPTHDKLGICLTHVEGVTNSTAAAAAIRKLDGAKMDEGIKLKRGEPRRSENIDIETYSFVFPPPPAAQSGDTGKPSEPSILFTVLSLFLKDAVLETAVKDGCLITLLGPSHSIEGLLADLTFADKPLTLRRRIGVQDAALSQDLYVGSQLTVTALLRHLVAIMPGVRPEHLRVLVSGGDGATFGIGPGDPSTLTASLRIQTNEIAALQRINREGREVLQELFFQMFSSKLLDLQRPTTPDKEKKQP